jgi:RND family efflux transporter MFP subunit
MAFSVSRRANTPVAWALAAFVAATSCRSGPGGGAGGPGGHALPVRVAAARAVPIDDVTEYVAALKSRDSAVIMPDVEGRITRIYVSSGDRVKADAPLLQIDPARQEATVKSQQDLRTAKQASLEFARQQFERTKALQAEGVLSQNDLDQARTSLDAARAELESLDAQVREQQVQLHYHDVTAPTAGIVGDIPVRVGDRVTTSTLLTTLVRSSGLEVYVSVPVERSPDLRQGMPLQILDSNDAVAAETKVSFVSPQVEDATQTVLAKAWVPPDARALRPDQFVRARVVWGREKRLVIPVLAVTRLGGQYFAFVAEKNEGGLVARQKPVRLGEIVGNDYVVLDGIAAGDQIIVSGTQMLADGVPVRPQEESPKAGGTAPGSNAGSPRP